MAGKVRIDITLDDDVAENVKVYAEAQRKSVSGMINEMLADRMGMRREFVPDTKHKAGGGK